METVLLVVHYLLCFFLIVVILLQAGKGAEIGAAFGGSSQTVFGSRGPATFLSKMTAIVAVLFLATSISLAQLAKTRSADSVIDKVSVPAQTGAPAPQAEPVPAEESAAPAEQK